jgi:hypothetical protein
MLSYSSASHNICFSWVILQGEFIVLDEFHPSPLPHVQLLLVEQILQAFVITEDSENAPIEVVSPYLQCKHDSS